MIHNNPATLPIALIKQHGRLFLGAWFVLVIIVTATGSRSILTKEIHPLYLVLSILVPSLFFLICSFVQLNSIFSKIFFSIGGQIIKRFFPQQLQIQEQKEDFKIYPILMRFITHSTWSIIFATLIVAFFIKFAFQSYHFYLGTTLFSSRIDFYHLWIKILNFIPYQLGLSPLSEGTIINTLNNNLTESDKEWWAKWILIMFIIYGFIPRLLLTCYYCLCIYQIKRKTIRSNQGTTQATVIDAAKVAPSVQRPAKIINKGTGSFTVALDIPIHHLSNNQSVHYLNDIKLFTQFEQQLINAPALHLTIFVDGNQTPDRGILRRIIRLLNQSVSAEIICYFDRPQIQNRYQLWYELLIPILLENETLSQSTDFLDK